MVNSGSDADPEALDPSTSQKNPFIKTFEGGCS